MLVDAEVESVSAATADDDAGLSRNERDAEVAWLVPVVEAVVPVVVVVCVCVVL